MNHPGIVAPWILKLVTRCTLILSFKRIFVAILVLSSSGSLFFSLLLPSYVTNAAAIRQASVTVSVMVEGGGPASASDFDIEVSSPDDDIDVDPSSFSG